MTRSYVYVSGLVAFIAGNAPISPPIQIRHPRRPATALNLASIAVPRWITFSVHAGDEKIERQIGLHKSCSTLDSPHCRDFPYKDLCLYEDRYFCSMWRTVGFLESFTALICLAGLACFVVIIRGGKYKRETGWPVPAFMMTLAATLQFVVISIVAYLYDHDEQFTVPGWNLDASWAMAVSSASICLLSAVGISASAYLIPPEGGYTFLDDPLNS
ncbi:unnamed protein product [Clonostachys rosea]|uniref:MARVEL domain-containing protein n=1 Tax=Bionectria ochroleuca TaxID=29856 RepID=A0ABY6TNP5_BIOOC|nr:unnamed protein product [Clonostachys rosea]